MGTYGSRAEDPGHPDFDKPIMCPECWEKLPSYEDAGPHIERHRPTGPPRFSRFMPKLIEPCSKGCGRTFAKYGEALDQREHEVLCSGEPPLARIQLKTPVGDETMAEEIPLVVIDEEVAMTTEKPPKWSCQVHGVQTSGPAVWSRHVRESHGGVDPISGKTLKGRKRDGSSSPVPATTTRPKAEGNGEASEAVAMLTTIQHLEAERNVLDQTIGVLKKRLAVASGRA